MKQRIRLDTMADIQDFVNSVSEVPEPVYLTAGTLKVSAKSLLGAVYSMEWDEIWCECARDISGHILRFVV